MALVAAARRCDRAAARRDSRRAGSATRQPSYRTKIAESIAEALGQVRADVAVGDGQAARRGWSPPATAAPKRWPSSSASGSAARCRAFVVLATPVFGRAERAAGARRRGARLPAAGHGARPDGASGASTASGCRCPTRSTCWWSASRPASASTRRSSASARSWRSRIRICPTSCGWSTSSCGPARRGRRRCTTWPTRTGVDDLSSLVAMLVQTDKFGTSVAQSLRVHSETLRTKRRQRAEEAAAKTGVKMVFPLVFCIFPAIWVVTIGPAAIKFVQVLFPMAQQMTTAVTRRAVASPRRSTRRSRTPAWRRSGRAAAGQDALRRRSHRTGAGRAHAPAVRRPRAARSSAPRAERLIEVRGATGTDGAELPLRADRPRPRPRAAVSRHQPVHRRGAGAARHLRRADARAARRRAATSIASGCARASRT